METKLSLQWVLLGIKGTAVRVALQKCPKPLGVPGPTYIPPESVPTELGNLPTNAMWIPFLPAPFSHLIESDHLWGVCVCVSFCDSVSLQEKWEGDPHIHCFVLLGITAAALATGACIVGILCLPLILLLVYKQRQVASHRRKYLRPGW